MPEPSLPYYSLQNDSRQQRPDVVVCQTHGADDGSGDDQCRREAVALELFRLTGDGSLHLSHAVQCRRMDGESLPQHP